MKEDEQSDTMILVSHQNRLICVTIFNGLTFFLINRVICRHDISRLRTCHSGSPGGVTSSHVEERGGRWKVKLSLYAPRQLVAALCSHLECGTYMYHPKDITRATYQPEPLPWTYRIVISHYNSLGGSVMFSRWGLLLAYGGKWQFPGQCLNFMYPTLKFGYHISAINRFMRKEK